jgi:hypothetical protein
MTGRNVYQGGEADGSFYMTVVEEDGTSTDEFFYADGTYE